MVVLEILRNIFLVPLELIFEAIFTLAFNITHSEGVAIILLSLVVSTLVLPLFKRSDMIETEQRAKEKAMSHWVEHIKKHFTGDEKYMTLDAYYREQHYSPIHQLKSSISLLLQIPFFSAAYDLLGVRATRRFAGTSFLFLNNLDRPDGLLAIGGIAFNVLPFVMTVVNLVATYIYTRELPFKTAIRSYILPVVFLVLLYNCPSALLMYWTMNNIYSLIKTILLRHNKNSAKHTDDSKAFAESNRSCGTKGIASPLVTVPNTGLFVLSAVLMSVLTGLMIPLTYISASPVEFINIANPQNPLRYLQSSFFVSLGFFVLWPGVFYYIANKRVRNIISVLMFGIVVCSAVNFLFFGSYTGTINTTLIFDRSPSYPLAPMVVNIFIVALILVTCFFLCKFRKTLNFMCIAAVLATLTISIVCIKKVQESYNTVMENLSVYQEDSSPKIMLSSEDKNVVVIMLDRAISGFIPYVFYEFPDIAEKYDGFTYYPNTVSFGQNTLKTTAALFGGYEYTPERMDARADETLAEKHDEAYRVMPVLFSDAGFSVTLLDLPFVGWNWNGDYSSFKDIDNCFSYHVKDYYNIDTESNINTENRRSRNLFMYSIFRCAPLCFQSLIYDEGDYLSVREDDFDVYNVLENYKVLENLDEMTQIDNSYSGSLIVMNNNTTHDITTLKNFDPYTLGDFADDGYYISNGTDELYIWDPTQAGSYECLVAAMRELGNYMDYLRANDLYDNTRIIIVSDHGNGMFLFNGLVAEDYSFTAEWFNPLLMVKDFDSVGYKTDYTFMTNADVPVIAMEGIINDPVNPATGVPINSAMKYGNIYIGYAPSHDETLWNPDYNQGNTFVYDEDYVWFKLVNENIFDLDNWILTDYPPVVE